MVRNLEEIKVIGFDADDTLWVNETYFREAENAICKLLSHYETPNKIDQEIFKMEMKNLGIYGYGVKAFILSMVEVALELSNHNVSNKVIAEILDIGKTMLNKPVELLSGIETALKILSKKYRLIVITKGDLLDQERKLERSGLSKYFHHIEIVSDKQPYNYSEVLKYLDIEPESFLMVGNSLKSDILPLISIGAQAVHIPFHTTWAHETVSPAETEDKEFTTLNSISELAPLLAL